MPEFEQALVFKLRIGFGHSVMTDDEFFRQRADSRQLISMLQDACFNGVPDLLHQLQIERLSGGWIQREDQLAVPLLVYSDHARMSTGSGRRNEEILRHAQRLEMKPPKKHA